MHSWQKDPNPLIYKDPPILPTSPPKKNIFFSMFVHPTILLTPVGVGDHCYSCCLASLAEWVIVPYLLTDIMDLHLLSLNSSVTKGPWHVIYATRHQVYWGLTHNVVFCWYSALISHTQKHIHTKGHNTLRDQ